MIELLGDLISTEKIRGSRQCIQFNTIQGIFENVSSSQNACTVLW